MTFHAQADSLESKAQLLSNALLQLDELSAGRAAQAVNSMEELHTTRTVVTDAAGVAVYDSLTTGNAEGKTLLFPELVTALDGSDVFFSRGGRTLGAVYLMSYDTDQGELIAALERNILRISFALEGGVVLFSLFFSAAFSRRMRAILNQVGRMREGDYSQQPPVRGHDEVERLSRAFNELAARLESSEARRRQFVSDASHELKTPLASIKLLSDSILQNEMDPETQREFIGDIGREADRLGRLTQKLLTLTKLDSSVEEEREILDAAPVVRKVVRMLLPLARLRGIGIDTTFEPDCSVMTVEDDLYQIVFNLTENAIKYNRQDGWVGVSVRRADDQVELRVEDNGAGIPPESMEHIFERFYRVDKARSRAAGGAGLGLSIVHDMVERSYGTITVQARPGGGTIFTVRFPHFDLEEDET